MSACLHVCICVLLLSPLLLPLPSLRPCERFQLAARLRSLARRSAFLPSPSFRVSLVFFFSFFPSFFFLCFPFQISLDDLAFFPAHSLTCVCLSLSISFARHVSFILFLFDVLPFFSDVHGCGYFDEALSCLSIASMISNDSQEP